MAVQDRFGAYLPTTEILNVQDPEQLQWILNNMSIMINNKITGFYTKTQFITGKKWYPDPALTSQTPRRPTPRMVYGIVVPFGALPNTATKTVAHGITFPAANTYQGVQIYACATDPTGVVQIPIPYSSPTLVDNIELFIDGTNVSITTGADWSAFTKTDVYFEFIKE